MKPKLYLETAIPSYLVCHRRSPYCCRGRAWHGLPDDLELRAHSECNTHQGSGKHLQAAWP